MFGISGLPQIPGEGSPRLSQEMQPSTVYPIPLQLIPNLSRRAFYRFSNGARTRSGSRSVPSAIPYRRENRLRRCRRYFNDVSLSTSWVQVRVPKRECQIGISLYSLDTVLSCAQVCSFVD